MSRPDPRAEPAEPTSAGAEKIERVAVSNVTAATKETETETAKPAASPPSITNEDPRIAGIEPLVKTNDWKRAASVLGPVDDAGSLPPNLGLIAAVAHHEALNDPSPEARAVAIRCMAALLG